MADLDLWIGTDQFDTLETKTNAAIAKVNDIKEFLEPLTAGQVPRQVGTTDFEFEGVFVPTLKAGEAAREKVRLSIGDWNMDSAGTLDVPHNLTSGQWKTMAIINVIVRNDADDTYYSLTRVNETGDVSGGIKSINATNITLARNGSGFFDSSDFNSTTYNRGFIDIEYTP